MKITNAGFAQVQSAGMEVPRAELVERYNRPGPRYTSYPPVPYWTAPYGEAEYARALAEAGRRCADSEGGGADGAGHSLYIHIPFCERRCTFCACNVVISRQHSRGRGYIAQLAREMDLTLAAMNSGSATDARPVISQMHWGGGTPTWLSADELNELCSVVADRFELATDREQSVEVDPRVTTAEQLSVLRSRGLTRVSMGVQDFDDRVQRAVNRVQPLEQTRALIEHARAIGIEGVNVDLIYGLPHQSIAGFMRTVEAVLALGVDRVALYNFAWLPGSLTHHKAIDAAALPAPEVRIELFRRASARFAEAGYVMIGLDHFARTTDDLALALGDGTLRRNFMGYTTRADAAASLLSFGVSSISRIGRDFAQNAKTLQEYESRVNAGRLAVQRGMRLSDDDLARESIIQRLMCYGIVDFAEVERRFGRDVPGTLDENGWAQLRRLEDDGLIELDSAVLRVRPLGRFFLRNIAMVFDAYLGTGGNAGAGKKAGGRDEGGEGQLVQVRFSRTV